MGGGMLWTRRNRQLRKWNCQVHALYRFALGVSLGGTATVFDVVVGVLGHCSLEQKVSLEQVVTQQSVKLVVLMTASSVR